MNHFISNTATFFYHLGLVAEKFVQSFIELVKEIAEEALHE